MSGWEDVCDATARLKVPGGWLYRVYHAGRVSVVFVAEAVK